CPKLLRAALVASLTLVATDAAAVAGSQAISDVQLQAVKDWKAARDRGDNAAAMRIIRPLAEQGFAAGQAILGAMYYDGEASQRTTWRRWRGFERLRNKATPPRSTTSA